MNEWIYGMDKINGWIYGMDKWIYGGFMEVYIDGLMDEWLHT